MKIISPSLLNSDTYQIKEQFEALEKCGINYIHIDITDGHFVPMISFGANTVKDLRKHTDFVLDCHLMVENPENLIPVIADAGADIITVHTIWNFWFPCFLGLVAQAVTGNFVTGILGALVAVMLQWLLADIFQKKVSEFFGYPGIAISHMMALSGALIAVPLNWIFDRIPGFNKIEADSETIAKRFGFFGDTVVIGIIIGMIVGFLAKYDFAKAAQLGMATGAVMKIMPKMVAMFMEGLMPIAEAAKEFANKRLGGRSVNIGMDAALTVGHSTVMSTNLLMVPISLALAIILPGNQTLPFGDLAFYAFGICLMIPIFRGNVVRSIVGCSIYMVSMLYLSTWLAPIITNVFKIAHYNVGTSGQVTSVLCGIWPAGLFAVATKSLGNIGLAVIGVVVIALLVYVNKIRAQKEN